MAKASIRMLLMTFGLGLGSANVQADFAIDGEGIKQPFCESILKALNLSRQTPKTLPCISEVVLSMPGVSDPPWEKLDLAAHETLARELVVYKAAGPNEYFSKDVHDPRRWPTAAQREQGWNHAKQMGAELFVFRQPDYGNMVRVTLRYKNQFCGDTMVPSGEASITAWATPELTQIVNAYPGALPKRPLVYLGRIYYVGWSANTGLELDIRNQFGDEVRMCRIEFSGEIHSKRQTKSLT